MTKTQLQIWHPDRGGSRQEWEVALLMYRAGPHGGQRKCPECGRLFDPRVNKRAYDRVLLEQRYCGQRCVIKMMARRNLKARKLKEAHAHIPRPPRPDRAAGARLGGAAAGPEG